jgi:hypothetical protein
MSKRIQIVLPDNTMSALDRVTTPGNRSRFIDRAVRHLIETEGKMNLRERLKQEAIANAERDLGIAAAWFPLEQKLIQPKKGRRDFGRALEQLRDETAKTPAGKLTVRQIDAEITAARRDRRMPKSSSRRPPQKTDKNTKLLLAASRPPRRPRANKPAAK